MSGASSQGGQTLAAFNRCAESRRNHVLLMAILESVLLMVRDDTGDPASLQAQCEQALPLWHAELESKRATHLSACGEVRLDQPGDVMVNLLLEVGAAGASPLEIQRLQEPLWPAVFAWMREHKPDETMEGAEAS
jgi:hypothetical protein